MMMFKARAQVSVVECEREKEKHNVKLFGNNHDALESRKQVQYAKLLQIGQLQHGESQKGIESKMSLNIQQRF